MQYNLHISYFKHQNLVFRPVFVLFKFRVKSDGKVFNCFHKSYMKCKESEGYFNLYEIKE